MESAVRQLKSRAELLLAELETLENKVHGNLRERFNGSSIDPAQLLQRLAKVADRLPGLEERHESIEAKERMLASEMNIVMKSNRHVVSQLANSLQFRMTQEKNARKVMFSEQMVNVA